MIGRAKGEWFQYAQPERVVSNPGTPYTWDGTKEKNVVFTPTAQSQVTLDTDQTKVPRGSVVRVFNLGADDADVVVKVGTTTLATLSDGQMGEFLFYVDGTAGKWLVLQKNVATGRA